MKRMFGSVRRVCPKTLLTPAAIASDPRAAVRRMSRLVCRMDQDSTAPDRSRNRISTESPCLYLSLCLYLINCLTAASYRVIHSRVQPFWRRLSICSRGGKHNYWNRVDDLHHASHANQVLHKEKSIADHCGVGFLSFNIRRAASSTVGHAIDPGAINSKCDAFSTTVSATSSPCFLRPLCISLRSPAAPSCLVLRQSIAA